MPEQYDHFCRSLLLADRLQKIKELVDQYLKDSKAKSLARKKQKTRSFPLASREELDHSIDSGEVSIDEVAEGLEQYLFHFKARKREEKAAAKEQLAKDKKGKKSE